LKNFFHNKFNTLLFACTCFLLAFFINFPTRDKNASILVDFQQVLHKKEKRLEEEMLQLNRMTEKSSSDELFSLKPDYYNSLFQKEGLALLIYDNDTLKFWSDNDISIENNSKKTNWEDHLIKLHNGWFEVLKIQPAASPTKLIIGLILIKNEYSYQNQYLVNEFQNDFGLSADNHLEVNKKAQGMSVYNQSGHYLFSLLIDPSQNNNLKWPLISLLLYILGFLFFAVFLSKSIDQLSKRMGIPFSLVLLVIVTVLFRYISIKTHFPDAFYNFPLFGPQYFADANSFWLPSLGDFLINAILLFYLACFIYKKIDLNTFKFPSNASKVGVTAILLAGVSFAAVSIHSLITGLIINSNISFNLNNIFSLSVYSYIAIVIMGLLLFTFFLITDKAVELIRQFNLPRTWYLLIAAVVIGVLLITCYALGYGNEITILWSFVVCLIVFQIKKVNAPGYSFSGILLLVFIFSIFAVHTLLKQTQRKENETRKVYAERLAMEQDPLAEHLFQEIEPSINSDSTLIYYIKNKKSVAFEKRLKQEYFSGYWDKYDIRISPFDSNCVALIKSNVPNSDNSQYFDDLITQHGKETVCEHFYYLSNSIGKISYLAQLPIYEKGAGSAKLATVYIEFDSKFTSEEVGFPELLLDREIGLSQKLANYSYAKYKNGQLISAYGKYPYLLSSTEFGSFTNKFLFTDLNNYNHLIYRSAEDTEVIISQNNMGWLGDVTTFSYVFAIFSLMLMLILLFQEFFKESNFNFFSFKYRIQLLLVLIVFISLSLFGAGTIYYIKKQYEVKNEESISEKIHSVLVEIKDKLFWEEILNPSFKEYSSFLLRKSSNVFFSDINLYDAKGNLSVSSRPKLFDEGLTSKKMDPDAYLQMAINKKPLFIHADRIGKLEYLSAYLPVKNKNANVIGYLNLPYFAKQSEIEKEISTFLAALINIYVILFALSILVALFISAYVTKPLILIQNKMSQVKLGKSNELIEWGHKDEIGSLVSEYNRMIEELTKSAELLAKSERESAWREMAKQVAHEIKNPLTPMKLSVQHLQKIIKDKSPDLDQKMARFTQTLVEQIDALSSIANEFSSFAIMPKAHLEKINLQQVLLNVIHLYKDSSEIEINFNSLLNQTPIVNIDKEQLVRVFNNLIKNAIQAIPQERKGKINILLSRQNDSFLIQIKDNGSGIADEQLEKIFVPSFTTKTGGMGLGLPMVKNIIESCNGKIWFETTKDIGTTFFISLPVIEESKS